MKFSIDRKKGTDNFFLEMNGSRIWLKTKLVIVLSIFDEMFQACFEVSYNIIYAINLYYSQECVYYEFFFLFYLFLFIKLIDAPRL